MQAILDACRKKGVTLHGLKGVYTSLEVISQILTASQEGEPSKYMIEKPDFDIEVTAQEGECKVCALMPKDERMCNPTPPENK